MNPTKLSHMSDDHHFAIANVAPHSAILDHVIDKLIYLTIEPSQVIPGQKCAKQRGLDIRLGSKADMTL